MSEGALLITIILFFGKMKNACGFVGAFQFAIKSFIVFNRAPSDTLKFFLAK